MKDNSSHRNFRKGLNDYHDGDDVTHYLGNDDYKHGANIRTDRREEESKLNGKEAEGNADLEDIEPDRNSED